MGKKDQPKEKSHRALRRLESHLKSPKPIEERPKDSVTSDHADHHRVGSKERSISPQTRGESARSSRRESRSSSRSSRGEKRSRKASDSRHRSKSSKSSDRNSRGHKSKRRCRSRSSSGEPPAWAKKLLDQQKKNADELKRLKSHVASNKGEGSTSNAGMAKVSDYEFKYGGNKKQFELNRSVIDSLDRALASGDAGDREREINKGKNLLVERNKHIMLADKYGWDTVACYTAEPLAEDSADEKRIRKAIKESKSLRNEKKAGASRVKSKKPFYPSERPTPSVNERPASIGNFSRIRKPVLPPSGEPRPTCFRCWKPGHFARECRAANTRYVVSSGTGGNPSNTPN